MLFLQQSTSCAEEGLHFMDSALSAECEEMSCPSVQVGLSDAYTGPLGQGLLFRSAFCLVQGSPQTFFCAQGLY